MGNESIDVGLENIWRSWFAFRKGKRQTTEFHEFQYFDAWSCRVKKGLLGAIERVQTFLKKYPHAFVWKSDVKKFFDSIDQKTLLKILSLRIIKDAKSYGLIREIIESFRADRAGGGYWYAYWKSYEPDFRQYLSE